jgi:hypothetical protein
VTARPARLLGDEDRSGAAQIIAGVDQLRDRRLTNSTVASTIAKEPVTTTTKRNRGTA